MFSRLRKDIQVIKDRDPAAKNVAEILLCYAGLHAIWAHRLSHFFYRHGYFVTARLISNIARFFTGIEIHPGARIGEGLFIDHGTGIVIGETTIIGNNVSLYQGVTLGRCQRSQGSRFFYCRRRLKNRCRLGRLKRGSAIFDSRRHSGAYRFTAGQANSPSTYGTGY